MRDNESEFQPASTDGEPDPAGSWGTNGSGPAAGEGAADAADDESATFLADLARVMQAAAGAERLRISEDSERRRNAHLDLIRARETSEAEELRVLAEGDVKAIDAWADTEIERIQSERERRITSRRAELAERLEDHRSLIAREVDAVEAAIGAYRTEVEVYFSRLDAETDPVAIAREASRRPQFPILDTVGSNDASAGATAAAVGEPVEGGDSLAAAGDDEPPPAGNAPAGVVDRDATADAVEGAPPAADGDAIARVEPDAGAEAGDEQGEHAETKAQSEDATLTSDVAPRSSAALLQAVPTSRPMGSWFRRGGDAADRSETDG